MIKTPEATLEKAVVKYKLDRTNPEAVHDLYEAVWVNFGASLVRSGLSLSKRDLDVSGLSREQVVRLKAGLAADGIISEGDLLVAPTPFSAEGLLKRTRQEVPDMGFYLPEILATKEALPLLGKGFPEMRGWMLSSLAHPDLVYYHDTAGWMLIESSVVPPYQNHTSSEAREIFKSKDRLGQTAGVYIAGARVSKLVEGKYFDGEPYSMSRLLGVGVWVVNGAGYYGSPACHLLENGTMITTGPGELDSAYGVSFNPRRETKGPLIGFRSLEII